MRDIERGRGSGDPRGRAFAALPGPADLKEFVVLLFFFFFFQKELQLHTCFHLIPEPRPRQDMFSK